MFKVKNWDEFQHYKDRRPPWIKLHRTILEDRKWFKLSYASRSLAMCIWLIASEHEDHLSGIVSDNIEDLAFRARMDEKEVLSCIKELINQGFINHIPEKDSDLLANCYQLATPETESYSKETETKKLLISKNEKKSAFKPEDVSQEIWDDFLTHRKAKKCHNFVWSVIAIDCPAFPSLDLTFSIARLSAASAL